jgi:hypothetical protein
MNSVAAEDFTSTDSFRLPDNCTGRLCYAQRTAPTGERAFGHFVVEARLLADVILQQIDSPLLDDPGPNDLALHRWLRNPERVDEQPETLPPLPGELEHTIGQLFKEGRARAFCACCNRNVSRHEVRQTGPQVFTTRYVCPAGHLLMRVAA